MSSSARLLLADADRRRRDLLQKHLHALGFHLRLAADGLQAQQQLIATPPDIAILDVALPQLSGTELCRRLRDQGSTLPCLLLISSDRYTDRVHALEAGADDALSFPFALEELHDRIRALLRRARMGVNDAAGSVLRLRDLAVNTDTRTVSRAGDPHKLTVKEYDLLLYMLRHQQQVLSRQVILLAVWGDSWVGDDNLLDVYIRHLRKKLERPDLDPLIHTVRGVGFMLQ